jgi:PBP1b-binding outer membrane lipoprotein LpoB
MRRIALLISALLLSGCSVEDIPPSAIPPICKALVGPIEYNSTSPMSERYAAYLLALDLHQRNEIGRKLGCPAFK